MSRSLGADDSCPPADVDEAAARFRSLTNGKRLLIVLDNALDTTQVRPLLPADPGCGVLITSRRMPASLDGTHQEFLDVLPDSDAIALLTRLVGAERTGAEARATADVVRLCGRLPLAISLAAARENSHPGWSVHTMAERLVVEERRLSELRSDDRGVRAGFAVGYHGLDHDHRHLFRLIALLDRSDIDAPVAAALADVPQWRAEALLEELCAARLTESHAPGRHRMHDLLRLFARERALEEDTEAERRQAVRRGLHCYLATARATARLANSRYPWRLEIGPAVADHRGLRFTDLHSVHAWIDAEAGNLPGSSARRAQPGTTGSR
ncbi:hypothetical protein [Nonomuraea diastatica]|uniref:NB-ARC domain-containing protein n=1 Tax=Nonomuraea diastatica TaxID=1848329 RepID=A0A4R4WPY3_9ACTN|nr:hypothetical protein [Nonomuraea diastatica]TDD16510.1 hypothetical protein E1294_31085 [Nonomuraea diastatica]